MKDLLKLADECKRELDSIGINCGKVTFVPNSRAKKRWGQCRKIAEGVYEINISVRLLNDELDDNSAKTTIIHELLHAADGCENGHRGRWLQLAARVMAVYPQYDIKRCSSPEEKGISEGAADVKKLDYRYFYRCLRCAAEVKYKRSGKFTQHTNYYICRKCGGKFVRADEFDRLSPTQRLEMNRILHSIAPRVLSAKEKQRIYKMK